MGPPRGRSSARLGFSVASLLWLVTAVPTAAGADAPTPLLLLPIAGGTPGQEWTARALGGALEEGFGSLRSIRLVTGTARDTALRQLTASPAMRVQEFLEICRKAGAEAAVFGGATLVEGRLALELRSFDIRAGRELKTFHDEVPVAKAFEMCALAVRHVVAEAGLGSVEARFSRGGTTSLEAYAAYRAALLEEAAATRIEKLRATLKLDAKYLDATLRLGVELFRAGAVEEALGVLERAVELGPKVAETRNNYGVALAAAGKPEQAQREFEEALAISEDYAEARLNLARVLEDRGRLADAEKQYATLLEADATNDKARFGLAAIYDGTGRPELAVKEFRLLSARRPDLAEAEFIRVGQEARKAREYARAEKYFLRATDVNPQFAQAWAELGTNSYLAGAYAKGVEYFRKALAIDQGKAAYHYYLGLALDKDRQKEEALREYRRSVELGGPPEARLGLARSALDSGDPGLAVEELNRLLAVAPDNVEAKTLLAQATSELEARRRLVEGQSQFANQRLARLEQIIEDSNRANRVLAAQLQAVIQEKIELEAQVRSGRGGGKDVAAQPATAVIPASPPKPVVPPTVAAPATPSAPVAPAVPSASAAPAVPVAQSTPSAALVPPAPTTEREPGRVAEEVGELRKRLAGLQVDLTRAQADATRAQADAARAQGESARLQAELKQEREARLSAAEQIHSVQAAADAARVELAKKAAEAGELKGRLAAAEEANAKSEEFLRAERDRGAKELTAERDARRAEEERLRAELEAGRLTRQEKQRMTQELAGEKALAAAARAELAKREKSFAAELEARLAQIEKLKDDLAASQVRKKDLDRAAQELAEEKARAAAARAELAKKEKSFAAELEARQAENEKQRADLAAAQGKKQDLERMAQEFAAVQDRARSEREARERAEQALVAAREERQREVVALEARAAVESRTLAERDRALEKARQTVRDLALELGRAALKARSWESARVFLEQAADADPRSGDAWYGLGEALFQLGEYEKSKQMYQKAKSIF